MIGLLGGVVGWNLRMRGWTTWRSEGGNDGQVWFVYLFELFMSWPEQRVSPPIYNIKARVICGGVSLFLFPPTIRPPPLYFPFSSVSLTLSLSFPPPPPPLPYTSLAKLCPQTFRCRVREASLRLDTSAHTRAAQFLHVPYRSVGCRRRSIRLIGSYTDPAAGQKRCRVRTCPTDPEKLLFPSLSPCANEEFGTITANGYVSTFWVFSDE